MATTSYGTPYVEAADLVSGYPSTSLTLADRVDDISFKGNGINNQTGTTYTLDILDAGKTVTLSNASAVTVTIPTNTAEAIEVGSTIRFNNKGAGLVTIQPDAGVTLNGGNIILSQNAAAEIVKLDTNTWGQIATSSSLFLIATNTFSSVASVSINNCFSSVYENYRVVLHVIGSATAAVLFRFRAGGSDQTGSIYYDGQAGWRSSNSASNFAAAAAAQAHLGYTGTNSKLTATFDVMTARSTADVTLNGVSNHFDTGSAYQSNILGNRRVSAAAADGFTVYPGTGNITGTIRVYGYKD